MKVIVKFERAVWFYDDVQTIQYNLPNNTVQVIDDEYHTVYEGEFDELEIYPKQ